MKMNEKWFPWLYKDITPVVCLEETTAIYSAHLNEKDIADIPPAFVKVKLFRGLPHGNWGDLDPAYSLWHIRHSYFGDLKSGTHFDNESIYLLIHRERQTIELVFLHSRFFGVVACTSVTYLSPIWAHIVATLTEEKGWQLIR